MVWNPVEQAEALKTRFRALDAANAPDSGSKLEAVVWLIGWLQDRPKVTEPEYRTELARVQRDGCEWPEVRFG